MCSRCLRGQDTAFVVVHCLSLRLLSLQLRTRQLDKFDSEIKLEASERQLQAMEQVMTTITVEPHTTRNSKTNMPAHAPPADMLIAGFGGLSVEQVMIKSNDTERQLAESKTALRQLQAGHSELAERERMASVEHVSSRWPLPFFVLPQVFIPLSLTTSRPLFFVRHRNNGLIDSQVPVDAAADAADVAAVAAAAADAAAEGCCC